jgi:hypothetical protein
MNEYGARVETYWWGKPMYLLQCHVKFPVHVMKAYMGSIGTAALILNLSARWRWVVNFTPRPLCHREITPVPIWGWMGLRAGLDVLRTDRSLTPAGILTLDRPARSLDAINLSWTGPGSNLDLRGERGRRVTPWAMVRPKLSFPCRKLNHDPSVTQSVAYYESETVRGFPSDSRFLWWRVLSIRWQSWFLIHPLSAVRGF